MRIWENEAEFDLDACVAALGTFDGVHIGHQELIRRAMRMAKAEGCASVVYTFDRHPLALLKPDCVPEPLTGMDEKMEKFRQMGVDGVVVRRFDRAFAAMEPEAFLETLARELKLRGIVSGFNYTFGAHGRGDADMIVRCAARLGYRAEIVQAVLDGQDVVSSTLIRRLLSEGDYDRAERLLCLSSVKV